jgi:ABC-type transporter Mla MlaB component
MGLSPPQTVAFSIYGPIRRSDLPGLSARVCAMLHERAPTVVLCRVDGVVHDDAVTVDALARLQLAARRHGCQIRLAGASPELCDLVAFMGLRDVIPGT